MDFSSWRQRGKACFDSPILLVHGPNRASFCLPLQAKKAMSTASHPSVYLHVLGSSGTSNNLDQLASNDGLTGTVEENLVLVDHLTGVLRGVLYYVCQQ